MPTIAYPDHLTLAHLPTPLQHLPRTSAELGVALHIKRDDLTGSALSGNKIRKLEYLLADARAQGADTIITCGGEQSNHCRATALAAAKVGMQSLLLLRTGDPNDPPADTGNILLDRLAGADIAWISMDEWRQRNQLMAEHAERLRARGRVPYIVPEGGSNAVGAWGYVRAAEELAADLAALDTGDTPAPRTTLVYAAGSGGTGAGLILGAAMHGLPIDIVGICVCDDRAYFVDAIHRICGDFDARYGTQVDIQPDAIDIVEDYVGRGYGKTEPAQRTATRALAQREAIILDGTYTGKAFYGLTRELQKNRDRFGERVIFLHTGGIFGLFR